MEAFDIEKTIAFKVLQKDDEMKGTITFGVTRNNPKEVNFKGLPSDPKEMLSGVFKQNWFLNVDVMDAPVTDDLRVCMTRTMAGITMRTSENLEDQVVIEVDPTVTLYPFFCLNGCVKSLCLLKEFKVRKRVAMECCVCLEAYANHFCKPCKHLVFCEDCLKDAKLSGSANRCPLCREPVKKFDKIFV